MQELIVIHPAAKISKTLQALLEECGHFISFGEKYGDVEQFQKRFKGKINRINIARDLESIFPSVAKAFSDSVADLAEHYSKLIFWWLSPYTEKNGWPSPHIVAETVLEWLKQNKDNYDRLVLLTSNPFFGLCPKAVLPDIEIKVIGKARYYRSVIRMYPVALAELLYFCLQTVREWVWMSRTGVLPSAKNIKQKDNLILLRTYVNSDSFSEDGSYSEPKFENLKKFLEKKGYSVVYGPNLTSVENHEAFYQWVSKKAKDSFWLPGASLSLGFLLKTILVCFTHFVFYHRLGLRAIAQAGSFHLYIVAENFRKAQIPVILHRQGTFPKLVIFNWENKGYEKYMQILFRKLLPNTVVKGYMNGIPFPTGPEMLTFQKECKVTPYPNEIICISQYAMDTLLSNGMPREILKLGPALRYSYVFEKEKVGREKVCPDSLLVCLPLNKELSLELLDVIAKYSNFDDARNIIVKVHPFLDLEMVESFLHTNEGSDKVRLSIAPLREELRKALYFVYCGPTTTACEAVIAGKRLLKYVSKNRFSLDCLYYDAEVFPQPFSSAEELKKLLNSEYQFIDPNIAKGRRDYYFSSTPLEANGFEVFLEKG